MKHITIKTTVCLSLILFLIANLHAQQGIQYSALYKKLIELWKQKVEYDKAVYFQQNYPKVNKKAYPNGKGDAFKAYLKTVREIKHNKPTYLAFIDDVLTNHQKQLSNSGGFYTYVDPLLSSFDPRLSVKTVDFFRIVRYSLFEAKLDTLAPLEKVPFMDKKEWSPPTYDDFPKSNPQLERKKPKKILNEELQ